MMVDDIRPETNIEWLWTLDLVELSWEIQRYRRLKKRILDAHRVAAIEAILQRLDGEGMPSEAMPMVRTRARRVSRSASPQSKGRPFSRAARCRHTSKQDGARMNENSIHLAKKRCKSKNVIVIVYPS